ncbi:MAG: helix-turn-helix domain-containing protein [Eggerthellaceae bacterium]|nr:helix-turn-helix domain-containing protein [Eggerthellaceae bacterium]
MRTVNSSRAIGRIVKEQRVAAGLTQKKLAKKAGVSERLVIALELGDATGIRLDKLLQVLSALDLSLGVLGAGDDEITPQPKGAYQYAAIGFSDLPINFKMSPELSLPSLKEKK